MVQMKIIVSPCFSMEVLSIDRYIRECKAAVYHLSHNSVEEEEE